MIDDTIQLEDTQSILTSYIDSLEECEDTRRAKLKSFIKGLYVEAMNVSDEV